MSRPGKCAVALVESISLGDMVPLTRTAFPHRFETASTQLVTPLRSPVKCGVLFARPPFDQHGAEVVDLGERRAGDELANSLAYCATR